MPIDWKRFAAAVAPHQRFVLSSHVRPDCDALGSELGMAGVLESLGKSVRIINPQATPDRLKFIDPRGRIDAIGKGATADDLARCDAWMILDTSAWGQLGDLAQPLRQSKAARLVLDHHVSSDDLGAETFKDAEAEATGRLVIDAADALGVRLTKDIARPLFAAIATDTGWFRFRSVSAGTYRAVARLIDAGVEPADVYSDLYEQDSLERLLLMGRMLQRVTAVEAGRVVYCWVLRSDFDETGAQPADTEDVINLSLNVAGTEVALLLVEQVDRRFKVSFRSRSALDVSRVAETFGGGGHRAAAGAMVAGPLDAALAAVLDAVRAARR